MVDIQCTTADNRPGKKKDRKTEEEETTGQKYNGLAYARAAIKRMQHRRMVTAND